MLEDGCPTELADPIMNCEQAAQVGCQGTMSLIKRRMEAEEADVNREMRICAAVLNMWNFKTCHRQCGRIQRWVRSPQHGYATTVMKSMLMVGASDAEKHLSRIFFSVQTVFSPIVMRSAGSSIPLLAHGVACPYPPASGMNSQVVECADGAPTWSTRHLQKMKS